MPPSMRVLVEQAAEERAEQRLLRAAAKRELEAVSRAAALVPARG